MPADGWYSVVKDDDRGAIPVKVRGEKEIWYVSKLVCWALIEDFDEDDGTIEGTYIEGYDTSKDWSVVDEAPSNKKWEVYIHESQILEFKDENYNF